MIYLFSSTSCAPCQTAKEYLDKKEIEYTTIDIDEAPQEAKKHMIRTLPTLLVIANGEKQYIAGFRRNTWLSAIRLADEKDKEE